MYDEAAVMIVCAVIVLTLTVRGIEVMLDRSPELWPYGQEAYFGSREVITKPVLCSYVQTLCTNVEDMMCVSPGTVKIRYRGAVVVLIC